MVLLESVVFALMLKASMTRVQLLEFAAFALMLKTLMRRMQLLEFAALAVVGAILHGKRMSQGRDIGSVGMSRVLMLAKITVPRGIG